MTKEPAWTLWLEKEVAGLNEHIADLNNIISDSRRKHRQELLDELVNWVEEHIEQEYSSVGLEWSDISSWLRHCRESEQ